MVESGEHAHFMASELKKITSDLGIPFIFKASYDKANRTSLHSYRGPGLEEGLEILSNVGRDIGVPILSDVHDVSQVAPAARVLDVLQIPAFLCRQTDLIVAAARSGKVVNIKKGQFLSPWEMERVLEKVTSTGNRSVFITERGTSFGYNNLVVDIRSIAIMKGFGCPVVFDGTHSAQLPGSEGIRSGGQREFVGHLSRAAVAAGADGVFLEVHPDPDSALCDGANSLPLHELRSLLTTLKGIHGLIRS